MKYSEAEMIDGCRKKKPRLQEALFNHYGSRMMAVCLRYTKNRSDAEDIFQDAFVKVFTRIESYKGEGSFEGWMRHIFVNTAINHFHRTKKNQLLDELDNQIEIASPEQDALARLATSEILEMVASLPDGYRMVFNLYVVEGYTHKEIAELLSIAEGTSKSQLAKAKGLLQKMIVNRMPHVER